MSFQFTKSLIVIFLILFGILGQSKTSIGQTSKFTPLKKIVLIEPSSKVEITQEELNDLFSIKNIFKVSGISFSTILVEDLSKTDIHNYDIIVLPQASAKKLTNENANQIKDAVAKGSCIFFDGALSIYEIFGLKLKPNTIVVKVARDLLYAKIRLYWPSPVKLNPIDKTSKNCSVICVDDSTRLPLMVSGAFGKGKYIYFSSLLDPFTDKGYSKYPFLIELFNSVFGQVTFANRWAMEMYVDLGMYKHPIKYDELARKWRKQMIKVVHVGGWYYDDENVDYGKLINACHKNGIAVECWLEPPMISLKFWNDHPKWREKTSQLKDAQIDWRYLMNLSDPECRKQVFAETEKCLTQFDWDGVNLAELYFDPVDDGRINYKNFTPMNDIVREEYKSKSGFDPILLFDSTSVHYWKAGDKDWANYISYRKDKCYQLKTYFLDFLTNLAKKKDNFEVMLTVIDVTLTPLVSDYIGEDFQNTIALYKKYPITLQIEDPSNSWGSTPDRYDRLGKDYRQYVSDTSSLLFDCNVVNAHEFGFGGFPSEKPSGEELRQIAYNMSLSAARPVFYSEDALYSFDFKNISTALAWQTKITSLNESTWKIETPNMVSIKTGIKDKLISLDNKLWNAIEDDKVIIPKGEHVLTVSSENRKNTDFCLNLISAELQSASFTDKTIAFSYLEPFISAYAIVNKMPTKITIDGKQISCQVLQNGTSSFSIKLPKGKHEVEIGLQ